MDLPSDAWTVPADYYHRINPAAHQKANSIVDAALRKLKSDLDDVEITGKAFIGSPKQVIVEEAEAWKADLIVIGSHGYPTWERLLLGSVSQAVVSNAKCSVEVVRLPAQQKAAA
jgi:nucleotide-binding universal stress UspA family protein